MLMEEVQQSLHQIAAERALPSQSVLQSYITELEQDLRDTEFRLQYLYNHRLSILRFIDSAKRQLESAF
jgi:hypothetical protein